MEQEGEQGADSTMISVTKHVRRAQRLPCAEIKGFALLIGNVRESVLVRGAQRPILNLPLTQTQTVVGAWAQSVGDLAAFLSLDRLPILLSQAPSASEAPISVPAGTDVCVVPDRGEFRGTG